MITPHRLYKGLGNTKKQRLEAYQELFRYKLETSDIDKIRKNTNSNFVLGNERFAGEISKTLGRRVSPGKPGRPTVKKK